MSEETDVLYQKTKQKKRVRRIAIIGAAGVVVIGIVFFVINFLYTLAMGTYTNYSVEHKIEGAEGSSTNYVSYNGELLKYSRDGAEAYTLNGERLWNGSYEMKDPIVDTCREYAVIADRGNKILNIYNEKGLVQSITVDYPILKVQVAAQGVVAVLMEASNANYIRLYSPDGKLKHDMETAVAKSGFPLDLTLSDDGKKFVTSYMNVSTGKIKMNVSYYNLGEVGQNYNNRLVAGTVYEDTMIAKLKFIGNNTVCVYKEQGFELISMEQIPEKKPIVSVDFKEEIQSVFSNSSYVGFVLNGPEGGKKYRIVVYNTKGSKVLDKELDFEYTNLSIHGENIILYNYTECYIMKTNGHVRFKYKFTHNIDALVGTSEKKEFFLVSGNAIDVIKLKEAK